MPAAAPGNYSDDMENPGVTATAQKTQPIVNEVKIGRNDPLPLRQRQEIQAVLRQEQIAMKRGRGMKIRAAALAAPSLPRLRGMRLRRVGQRTRDNAPQRRGCRRWKYTGSNDAVVWLRNDESRLTASGSVERLRATVIMMGEKVPEGWKTGALSPSPRAARSPLKRPPGTTP